MKYDDGRYLVSGGARNASMVASSEQRYVKVHPRSIGHEALD